MKTKQAHTYVMGIMLFFLSFSGSATQCSFDLPPDEQVTINGNRTAPKTLSCKVEPNGQNNDYLLHFLSETNTSIVNNLLMPEGTLMSLSFASINNNRLNFEVEAKAKLAITNDTADLVRLQCTQS